MTDLGRNIRRIASSEELQRQINELTSQVNDLKDKADKLGDRSVAYQSAGGGVGQKSTDKLAAQVEADVSSALDDFSDGLEDVFSDAAGNAGGTGETSTPNLITPFTADLADFETVPPSIGQKIFKLDGLQEVSGSAVGAINLDGQFTPPLYPNGDFEGYGIDTDPREGQFVPGLYYKYSSYDETKATSAWACVEAYLPILDAGDPAQAPFYIDVLNPFTPVAGGVATAEVRGSGTWTGYYNITVNIIACTAGSETWCPLVAPVNTWPADSIHLLAFDGARFLTSALESLVDIFNVWDGGPSVLVGETSNAVSVRIEPIDQGGSMFTYGNGNVIKFNHDAEVIEIIGY